MDDDIKSYLDEHFVSKVECGKNRGKLIETGTAREIEIRVLKTQYAFILTGIGVILMILVPMALSGLN